MGQQQNQSQEQSRSTGNPQSALDDPAGDPRPEYDQYKVNQPDTVNKPGIAGDKGAHGGYGNAQDESGAREQQQADPQARQRRDQAEQQADAAPEVEAAGDGIVGETSPDPAARAKADAERPLQ